MKMIDMVMAMVSEEVPRLGKLVQLVGHSPE